MISKVIRRIDTYNRAIFSFFRKKKLALLYPGIKIDKQTYIGKNCKIICTDGASLILKNTVIDNGVTLTCAHGALIEITSSYIGLNSLINARESIQIKDNCQIAEMVVIRDQNHKFGENGKSIVEQGFDTAPIVIGENVWLGAKSSVLMGTTIGKNTVVGAHSLAKGMLNENSIYVGTPAKKIKSF